MLTTEQTPQNTSPEAIAEQVATRDDCNNLHVAATNRLNEALVDNTEPYNLEQLEGYDQYAADGEQAYTQTLKLGDADNPLTISRRVYGRHLHSVGDTQTRPSLSAHPVDRMITIQVPATDETTGAPKQPVEVMVINDGPTPEGVSLEARGFEGNASLSAATARELSTQISVLTAAEAA